MARISDRLIAIGISATLITFVFAPGRAIVADAFAQKKFENVPTTIEERDVGTRRPANDEPVTKEEKPTGAAKTDAKVETKTTTKTNVETKKAEKPKAEMKKAEPANGQAKPADPAAAQIQQYLQQCRPLLRAELHMVRAVCDLDDAQKAVLTAEGDKALKQTATRVAELQLKMQRGQWNWNDSALDVRGVLQESLFSNMKACLSADQLARYQAEITKRKTTRKRLAVDTLVAKFDHELTLSADQRDKIALALFTGWDESWCLSLDYVPYLDQYIPMIPDRIIVPVLDDDQKKVWQGISKGQRIFLGFGFNGNRFGADNALLDDANRPKKTQTATKPK